MTDTKATILYMEDDTFFATLLSKKLQNEGYQVVVAPDGVQGLEEMKKAKFDLLLLDILMPRMDGFSVLSHLKEDAELSQVPVIVLSNLGSADDMDHARELGAKLFLVKASTMPAQIVESVEQTLAQ